MFGAMASPLDQELPYILAAATPPAMCQDLIDLKEWVLWV
jgi:hypothetical protein